MRKYQVNILLLKVIKGLAFRQNASNQFMSDFNAALLIGSAGIAVENKAAKLTVFILLDRDWVAELTATVRQNHGKELTIGFPPKRGIEVVEHIQNRTGGVAVTQESEKQIAVLEEHGQKDLAAFAANDRVHLDNGDIGIVCHKRREILVGAPFIAVSIDFQLRRSPSRTHPDDAGTIHLVSVEQTGVQIIVGGLFADHQLVCIIHKSMMNLFDPVVFDDSVKEFLRLKKKLADYFDEKSIEDIFDYIPPQKTNQIFTPKTMVKKMVDMLETENPGCFDDPDKTFIDLYMKSGLYITEIVKRLYQSERMKEQFPDPKERLRHIFEKQVYGLAPTEIIYHIALSYILGFNEGMEDIKHNFRQLDALPYAKEGTLQEKLDELFG